jgi:non-ribosomal peptide synthetase component F
VLADPATRTITIFATPTEAPPPWARPGVVVSLEIAPSNAAAELSIPKAAILRDGLKHVFFRRDPSNPDRAIRLEADLGADDGRFVAIRSGVRDGDEVVLAGAYQLMLASSGSAQRGGHYHADGTFHADEK